MALVFLDLDHTLLRGDSDYLWGQFLIEKGKHVRADAEEVNAKAYSDYQKGELNYHDYLTFALAPLAKYQVNELLSLNHEFVETVIQPLIFQQGMEVIESHHKQKDRLVISSSTNSFIVDPIANLMGLKETICTQVEMVAGQYTGCYVGLPNYGENKVTNIKTWLSEQNLSPDDLENSYAYSDAYTDLPMLEAVDNPVAVNPDSLLKIHAEKKGWSIFHFSD